MSNEEQLLPNTNLTRGWTTKEWLVIVAATLAALVFLAGNIWWLVNVQSDGRRAQAESSLSNCKQIEAIKDQIRGTLQESVARLPKLGYYKEHPEELGEALENSVDAVARFAPNDCYNLPGVRKEGLPRP